MINAPRVHARSLIVFVDKSLQVTQRAVGFRTGEWRRQVVYDHGLRAAFRLCPLARVVHNERINVRQGPERDFWPAFCAQSEGFARQPFKIAMLAHVHDGICTEIAPKPSVERQVVVRRNEVRRMVGIGRVDVVASRWLHTDHNTPVTQDREFESLFRQERIILRGAPPCRDLLF